MNDTTAPKIRMSDVAAAVGMETKALRNWLLNNDLELIKPRAGERGWRAFSFQDVAVLAGMRELVRWGIKVDCAYDFIASELCRLFLPTQNYKNMEPKHLLALMSHRFYFFWYDGEELMGKALCCPDGIGLSPANATFIVDLHRTISAAFERLAADGYCDL